MNRIYSRVLMIVAVGTSSAALADCDMTTPGIGFKNSKVALSLTLSRAKFEIQITRGSWRNGTYRSPQMWGAGLDAPHNVLSSVSVKLNGERVFVPFSAYGDLAEPQEVTVRRTAQDVEVWLHGGQGGESYCATLLFKRGKTLVKRRVDSYVMKGDAWEETHYHFPNEK